MGVGVKLGISQHGCTLHRNNLYGNHTNYFIIPIGVHRLLGVILMLFWNCFNWVIIRFFGMQCPKCKTRFVGRTCYEEGCIND